MNLYIRYFNDETVVCSTQEALAFIRNIQGFAVTPQFEEDFRQYAEGSMPFPKRYKVRPRVYFIVIKTNATSLADFKANGKAFQGMACKPAPESPGELPLQPRQRELAHQRLQNDKPGWYEGEILFKRVVTAPATGKCKYTDTLFVARVKAHNPQECYDRIVDHLRSRADVDPRSQYPSARGKNFRYTYLGIKPYAEVNV